jgi:hypothetical protein
MLLLFGILVRVELGYPRAHASRPVCSGTVSGVVGVRRELMT